MSPHNPGAHPLWWSLSICTALGQQTLNETPVRLQQPAGALPGWVSSAQLQGWRFYSLSGTSAPVLGWPHGEEYFFLASHQNVHVAAASIASRRVPVSSSLRAPRKRKQLNPLVAFELSKPTSLSLFAHHPLTVTPWLSPRLSAKLSPAQHCLSGTPERH